MPASTSIQVVKSSTRKAVFSNWISNEVIRSNVRIIAATHVDLEKAVKKQSFRLDLVLQIQRFTW